MKIITGSPAETRKFAQGFARKLRKGDILCLKGELGSGKTTFIQGLARGLGIRGNVVSPTFVLLAEYKGKIPLYHFDLYRLNSTEEIRALGYEEFFYGSGITVIEWAEKLKELMPEKYIEVRFKIINKNKREIVITPDNQR